MEADDLLIERELLDSIGPWSELKHEIIAYYADRYVDVLKIKSSWAHLFKRQYIDGFASAGFNIRRGTNTVLKGSPMRVLEVAPPFDAYFFIEIDPKKVQHLRKHCAGKPVEVIPGDANSVLPDVLDRVQYDKYHRAFCLLDPYHEGALEWSTIEATAKNRAIDLLVHFPTMAINRNCLHRDGKPPASAIERMNKFWGDESWRDAAYQADGLFVDLMTKQPAESLVRAFQERLVAAGFMGTSAPIPMKNSKNGTVYHLIFASHDATGLRIMKQTANKFAKVPQPFSVPLISHCAAS